MNSNIQFNPDVKHRQTIRITNYDYSSAGAYFVTICTHNKECLFGEITDSVMVLNNLGKAAKECWGEIPKHYPNVVLDVYSIMPNHVHGIIVIASNMNNVGVQNFEPLH